MPAYAPASDFIDPRVTVASAPCMSRIVSGFLLDSESCSKTSFISLFRWYPKNALLLCGISAWPGCIWDRGILAEAF